MSFLGSRWPALLAFLCALECVGSASVTRTRNEDTTAGVEVLRPRANGENSPPSAANFISRAFHACAVQGKLLYIDGGEINYYGASGEPVRSPDYNTYSISLLKSWAPNSVVFNTIPKSSNVPVMNDEAFWSDRYGNIVLAFGGEQSPLLSGTVPATSLWKLTPVGRFGSWESIPVPADIQGRSGMLNAAGGFAAFALGGYVSNATSAQLQGSQGMQAVSGLTIYNFTSGGWESQSASGFGGSGSGPGAGTGTGIWGGMRFVQGFQPNGILIAFGGDEAVAGQSWTDNGADIRTFDTISVYDPLHGTWGTQTASGMVPSPRDRFCTVGVPSDDGTYEIYIFGGHVASSAEGDPLASYSSAQQSQNEAFDEVYVLSLPGFNWQKAQYTPTWPRVGHRCAAVGHSQMVVVGGVNPSLNESALYTTQDPWPNGIGVFDLTQMIWTNQYNALGSLYTSPAVVKQWYQQNGLYPKTWDSAVVSSYFVVAMNSTTGGPAGTSSSATASSPAQKSGSSTSASSPASSTSSSINPSSDSTSSTSSTSSTNTNTNSSTDTNSYSSGSNTGIIAGVVVVAVVLAAVIAGLAFFLVRRRRRRQGRSKSSVDQPKDESLVSAAQDPAVDEPSYLRPPPLELTELNGAVDDGEKAKGSVEIYGLTPTSPDFNVHEAPTTTGRYELHNPIETGEGEWGRGRAEMEG